MFFPLLGVLITKKICAGEEISLRLRPNFKGNVKYYLMAWFLPAICTFIGGLVYFLIFRNFEFENGYFIQLLQPQIDSGLITKEMVHTVLVSQMISGIFMAPFFNMLFAFGEEAGWRAFLQSALAKRFSLRKSILLTGLIWGLWHAPIIAMGHNYSFNYVGYPWLGIFAMCVFCIVVGIFLSYITIKTDSVWPAALAHGALNAIAGIGFYFVADIESINRFWGPTPWGLVGGIGFILLAIWCFIKLKRNTNEKVGESNESVE
ncbi:MAG: CPBP family intramembrane metalloprotease [Clostridia bacterium]|nr:CPBP family intramembrane metalloprotease [Clostridia bacterium]